ncbi:MAG: phenylalanine--tRNA ligase subunit beta [Anaerolineaceae bacterium]|nr:phenylalanine--tRNA ligase subunit beta [Anaerolineaceae bacterium]
MKVLYSWLKDYVDIDLSIIDLARLLTRTGMEVENISVVGMEMPQMERREFKMSGLEWARDKFVVARIDEVMPHPDADRLVLCKLFDGEVEHVVLTGAPDLYPYKGKGPLDPPIMVAYAKEGAVLYDGHKPGRETTKLKRAKIRGVESYSMVCSEKELGISDEHEGIIHLDADAPVGMPLMDYMGDAVFEFEILPNMIRNASVVGVAREVAAVLGLPMRKPQIKSKASGPAVQGKAVIQIDDSNLNPRFVAGLIENVKQIPSPYLIQRRLRLSGMRPINAVVDATNYAMLEVGQPLHAYDYDVLVKRAGGKVPTVITRPAADGEKITTLDDVTHTLSPEMIVVADSAGSLGLAGVMGGLESEITDKTTTVLLEGASWNFINVRRAIAKTRISSEAGYRFSRGIHPALCSEGVAQCLDYMALWSGGSVSEGLIDEYPNPAEDSVVTLTIEKINRFLGIESTAEEIAELLRCLEFECDVANGTLTVKTPPHRLDIGEGVIGEADVLEEIARMYGYDNIAATRLSDSLPKQRGNYALEAEEHVRDLLVSMGLQEVMTYRLTSKESEAKLIPADAAQEEQPYVTLINPITVDRVVMRRRILPGIMEVLERNARLAERQAIFEIGPVYLPVEGEKLPEEPLKLSVAMMGKRLPSAWDQKLDEMIDFYDMKGILESLLDALHAEKVQFIPAKEATYHPGKCAEILVDGQSIGVFGEMHPQLVQTFDVADSAVILAELDLQMMLNVLPDRFEITAVPQYPPVYEDLAIIVDEGVAAADIEAVIRKAGGKLLYDVQLFDIYRGKQIGEGKKSLAYSLVYLAPDRTLTVTEVEKIRRKVITLLERELEAVLRS